jgi:hypothetical protein
MSSLFSSYYTTIAITYPIVAQNPVTKRDAMKTRLKERFVVVWQNKHRLSRRRVYSMLIVLTMLATGLGTNWDAEEDEREYQRRRDERQELEEYMERMRNEQQEADEINELHGQVSDDPDSLFKGVRSI